LHTDGRGGNQTALGEFTLQVQVAAQATCTHRQHHVIHGRIPDQGANGLKIGSGKTARVKHPVR
jgi:hypothetical protein